MKKQGSLNDDHCSLNNSTTSPCSETDFLLLYVSSLIFFSFFPITIAVTIIYDLKRRNEGKSEMVKGFRMKTRIFCKASVYFSLLFCYIFLLLFCSFSRLYAYRKYRFCNRAVRSEFFKLQYILKKLGFLNFINLIYANF